MTAVALRLRDEAWWLLAGTVGMLMAALAGPQLASADHIDVRWSGVLLVAALGGLVTALVGPRVLPLAQQAAVDAIARGRRLRPLTQGAALGLLAASVAAVGVTLFPDLLAPVEVAVGHGIPRLLIDQLLWVVPAAGVVGALLGLTAWAVVTQRAAVTALAGLIRRAGVATWLCWGAAAVTAVASVLTGFALAAGSAGAGPVGQRMREVVAAGPWWPAGWAAWGLASLGLLAVLILLADRVRPSWRTVAVAVVGVAIGADLVSDVLLGTALPVAAAAREGVLFTVIERSALVLSGLVANLLYGTVGLLLVRAAGRRLHPLGRVLGAAAFAVVLASGVAIVAAPGWLAPLVGTSITLFIVFAIGLGWQLAVSRRQEPALESTVRDAVRTLVPLHPIPFAATARELAAVDLAVDPVALATVLPHGLRPIVHDGSAHVTVLGGITDDARPAFVPRWLGLPATPTVVLQVQVEDGNGGTAVTFLRGWADGTLAAATTHWLTELQLSRVRLEQFYGGGRWQIRGSAGSVQIDLAEDDAAPGLTLDPRTSSALVERGGRLASVSLHTSGVLPRPARVIALRIPFLERLGARPVGAALLGAQEVRWGRAHWRAN